jgi:hypothetical protein
MRALSIAAIGILTSLIGCSTDDVVWDLSKSNEVARLPIKWQDNASNLMSIKGTKTFRIITGAGTVSGTATSINLWRNHSNTALLDAIDIAYPQSTLDDAIAKARTLIEEFKPDDTMNSGWQSAVDEPAKWNPQFNTFERYWDKGGAGFGVRIRHSYDETTPWFVIFHMDFLPR